MRTRSILVVFTTFVLLYAAWGRGAPGDLAAPVEPYVDAQTVMVIRIDTGKLDFSATEKWVQDAMKADKGPAGQDKAAARIMQSGLQALQKWVEDYRRAGGRELFLVTGLDNTGSNGAFMMATLADGADPAQVGALLESGPNRSTTPKAHNPGPGEMRAQAIGKNVFYAAPEAIDQLRHFKPVERPELKSAFAEAGEAPLIAVVIPSNDLRRVAEALLPKLPDELGNVPTKTLTEGLIWGSAALDVPPTPSLHVVMQSRDADSARAMNVVFAQVLGKVENEAQRGSSPPAVAELAKALMPEVNGTRLTISIKARQLQELAGMSAMPLLQANTARERASQAVTMNHIRQLGLACISYANDHHDQWPDSLQQAADNLGGKDVLARIQLNRRHPDLSPAYIYRKPVPPPGNNGGRVIILYENHKAWDGGVAVGFADGHAEFIRNEQEFKKMMK